ncbi:MAG: hypothetical protein AAGC47_09195 [Bacteroidota bacterium]
MKHIFALVLVFTFTASTSLLAQENDNEWQPKNSYFSFEGEMIFSLAEIEESSELDYRQNLRWSPVFNLAWHYNYDVTDYLGFNLGLGIRNVGFIAKADPIDQKIIDEEGNETIVKVGMDIEDNDIDRVKYRNYNLGIPIGFKVGRLDQKRPLFLFAGYEIEFPFHYKEKEFDGNDKLRKRTDWFSPKTNNFQQAAFVGFQLPQGLSLKFKYYLTDFFDSDFEQFVEVDGVDVSATTRIKPFENFNARVFYMSLTWFPFEDLNYTRHKGGW